MQKYQEPHDYIDHVYQRKDTLQYLPYERTLKERVIHRKPKRVRHKRRIGAIIMLCIMAIYGFIAYGDIRTGAVIFLSFFITFMILLLCILSKRKEREQPHEDRNEKLYRE